MKKEITHKKEFSFEVETRTLGTVVVAISVWVEWRTNDNMGPAYKQMRSWKSESTITLPSGEVFEVKYEKQNRDHIESFALGKFLQKDGKVFIAVNTRPVGFYMSEVDAKRTRDIAEDLAEERRFWVQHDL